MSHRGRFQAQGGGLEESVPWDQPEPLGAIQGHDLLEGLRTKLPAKAAKARQDSFLKAHRFLDSAASAGGVGPRKKSFVVHGGRDQRVDIKVQNGLAFV